MPTTGRSEAEKILKRSSLLSLFLLVAVALTGHKIYQLWKEGEQQLVKPSKREGSFGMPQQRQGAAKSQLATEFVVEKNLFDPQRATRKIENTPSPLEEIGKIKDAILLGTLVAGTDRYAVLEIPAGDGLRARGSKRLRGAKRRTKAEVRRLTLGDTMEGFELAEIHEQKVVFKKGTSAVEVLLDFSRKVEEVKVPTKPRRVPKARPRRGR
ncbi:MAG: hypothetical protein ACE5JU_12560 [Candidatus Binatia bacterium]